MMNDAPLVKTSFQKNARTKDFLLRIVSVSLYAISMAFAITAAGLFGDVIYRVNRNRSISTKICPLFLNENNNPSFTVCEYVVAGEVVAAFLLLVLVILNVGAIPNGMIKLVSAYMRSHDGDLCIFFPYQKPKMFCT